MAENLLAPSNGIHDPSSAVPGRRQRSIRRTTSVDILRPDGPAGLLTLVGAGRDLMTGSDGLPSLSGEAQMTVDIDFAAGRVINRIDSVPPKQGLTQLVGARASSGFRKAMKVAFEPEGPPGDAAMSILRRLLDDVPVAVVISGFALTHELTADQLTEPGGPGRGGGERLRRSASQADYCAGFVSDGTMMRGVQQHGVPPLVTGPPAPNLVGDAEPDAWHPMTQLQAGSMRRMRRTDVWREKSEDGDRVHVDAMFRDSYVDVDGHEMVVHEYHLDLIARADSLLIEALVVTPRVLPWPECPGAVAGAQRLVGHSASAVESLVGQEFHGVSSCTHLNDLLRSIGDIAALAAHVPARTA